MKSLKKIENVKKENWFKNFKKNEIVIYVIVLMFVTAGYFNYTSNLDSIETYSEDIQNISKENNQILENITIENNIQNTSVSKVEDSSNNTVSKDEDIGDAKLVNSNDVVNNTENANIASQNEENINTNVSLENEDVSDYFVASKLDRDTNYDSMISTYTKILEDSTISETQKSIAMKEITKINDTRNAISVCENLISTKGFSNSLVLVNTNSVNVVVQVDGGLTKEKVAQLQNIISRELDSEIANIHITEK